MKKFLFRIVSIISILVIATTLLFCSACEQNYPESRTFIITDRKNFEKIIIDDFSEFEVDFDKEMLIVYTFAIEYVLPAKIANVELNDKTLTVNYNIELTRGELSARAPYQRWFIVKLDKLDITSVKSSVSIVYTDEENTTEKIVPYHAKLFDNCGPWIKEKFQTNNRIKGAIYY